MGLRGDNCLGTFTLKTTPDTVNIKSRTSPKSLQGVEPFFPIERRRADGSGKISFVERQVSESFFLLLRQGSHIVVEPGDGDSTVLILHGSKNPDQSIDGIDYGAPERARVQIYFTTFDFNFRIGQPPYAISNTGKSFLEHTGIGDQNIISFELLGAFPQDGLQER